MVPQQLGRQEAFGCQERRGTRACFIAAVGLRTQKNKVEILSPHLVIFFLVL